MGDYYPDEYGPYASTKVAPTESKLPNWLKVLGVRVFRFNARPLPNLPPGHMLEIGCASGAFLAVQQAKGWSVSGIEFSKVAAANARQAGFDVHIGALEDAPVPKEKFNLIVGWMVFEHLHDPLEAMRRLHDWTHPGGWMVLSLPNAGTQWFTWLGSACYDLHLPNHLFHFSPATLRKVLNEGGWRVERIFHHRLLSSFLGSLGYKLEDCGLQGTFIRWLKDFPKRATRLHFLFYPLAFLLAAFGQTGRMTVWARRIDD